MNCFANFSQPMQKFSRFQIQSQEFFLCFCQISLATQFHRLTLQYLQGKFRVVQGEIEIIKF